MTHHRRWVDEFGESLKVALADACKAEASKCLTEAKERRPVYAWALEAPPSHPNARCVPLDTGYVMPSITLSGFFDTGAAPISIGFAGQSPIVGAELVSQEAFIADGPYAPDREKAEDAAPVSSEAIYPGARAIRLRDGAA